MKPLIFLLCILPILGCSCKQNQSNKLPVDVSLQNDAVDSLVALITTESSENRNWTLGSFVDDFGDATKDKFMKTQADGVFSNSATVNSYLFAEVLFTKNSAGIFLHEYKKTAPAVKIIDIATIMLKNSKDEILKIYSGSEWSNSGGIAIKNIDTGSPSYDYYNNLRMFIQNSVGEIKVVISDKYSSTYKFTINSIGFSKAFRLL